MNDPAPFDEPEHEEDWNSTRADRLISRIVDRHAEPGDWSSFADLARVEPAHWEQLLSTLRTDGALRTALGAALQAADRVETQAPVTVLGRWRQWSGWAAAAMLALTWSLASTASDHGSVQGATPAPSAGPLVSQATSPLPGSQPAPVTAQPAQPVSGTPVFDELPLRLVGTRPGPQGRGVEVTYVRPIVERTVVDGVYSVGTDELGRPMPVSIDPKLLAASNEL
jgi:hypothetical protein